MLLDPFDAQLARVFLQMNPDASFKLCLERATSPFEKTVNFLGQSTLHVGIYQPQQMAQLLAAGHPVDLGDKNGITPLMYAASMNVPDAVMMLIKNGASLLCHRETSLDVLSLIARRGNWDLIWQIVDFAAVSYPSLVPELFTNLLDDLGPGDLRRCYAAHDPSGLKGCIKFWSRVISKLGSPNFYFNDGMTLMHMTNDARSARALIDLGFTEFKQKDGALLEHLVSLRDLSLFRFAVGNGGDEHLHNDWGWDILNVALGGLATESPSDTDNDRFWDISEQIRTEELNQEMEVLAAKTYPELKIEAMVRLRCQWRKRYMELWPAPRVAPRLRGILPNKRVEDVHELLNVIRTSEYPEIPEPFSSCWDGIVQKKLDSGHWNLEYDIELGLVEFGIVLYQYGGDQFVNWIPLLTQMTDVLLAEEEPEARIS
ncbi:hypothetical protein FCOIX_1771 [Fusarium coicis]|nr:hypothetical protein FCOIX_1771 [Fusarium coicis]